MSVEVARRLLAEYQSAMLTFSADDLAGLYAEDGVHEFGFFTPGHEPAYVGREQIRHAYRRAWAAPAVTLLGLTNDHLHETGDGLLITEWSGTARRNDDRDEFRLAGVLVLQAGEHLLTRVRDYMDVLGLAHRTGRLAALAGALARPGY